jgi:hypothetical protein
MTRAAKLEEEVLSLPPKERAHLALKAWESLVTDTAFAADRTLDPEGSGWRRRAIAKLNLGRLSQLATRSFFGAPAASRNEGRVPSRGGARPQSRHR